MNYQWDPNKGIRIAKFRRLVVKGNFKKSPWGLDLRKDHDLIIDVPKEALEDGYEFQRFLFNIICDHFGDLDQKYVVLGRPTDDARVSKGLWCVPVAYFNLNDNNINYLKVFSYRQKYGKGKSQSTKYRIFHVFPELLDFVAR